MYPRKRLVIFLLLLIQVVVLVKNRGELFYDYYWFCDFAPALFVAFFLSNNTQAIKGLINILLFGQLGYILIILAKVVFGVTLMNFTFDQPLTYTYIVYTLAIHVASPIAFLATRTYVPTRASLLYSVGILIITYSVIILSVAPSNSDTTNYNLIFHSHLFERFPYYSHFWVVLAFIFVVLPTHVFQCVVSTFYKDVSPKTETVV